MNIADRRGPESAKPETPALNLLAPPPSDPDDEGGLHGFALDRLIHANQAQLTGGLSPAGLQQAFADWAIHLADAPGKQADLLRKAFRKWVRFLYFALQASTSSDTPPAIEPLAGDRRFVGPDWQKLPFSLWWQGFLFTQQWWHNATTGIRGVNPRHAEIVHFTMRQILDAMSPSNFLATNPEVLRVTLEKGGANLWQGWQNWLEDSERKLLGRPPVGADAFRPGENVAVAPGKIVYRNELMELIQYTPATDQVAPEPVLIVPAWIMKYYILDLRETNSLVRYLVGRGHTLFMISWKNPTVSDRDFGMQDYLDLGPLKALEIVRTIVPGARRSMPSAIAWAGRCCPSPPPSWRASADDCLRTVTLLAAQTDFTEAGELMLFINDSQVAWLEDMMWDKGYLDTSQMAGAFQLLRSNDLVWSTMVRQYLLGERAPVSDLMSWNSDATRMPYRMHSEYLRHLFLDNDLAEGRYRVDGKPVSLSDVRIPIFAVATIRDHIAPWRSVYKLTWLTQSDITFVLASGGHNVGIVSPPGEANKAPNRDYRIGTIANTDYHVDADSWMQGATRHPGSWWPAWAKWLEAWSGEPVAPPPMGATAQGYAPQMDAPGSYVLQR